MKDWLKDKLLPALVMAILAAAISTYIEVKLLRADVDRIEVYLDMLWKEK